MQGEGILFVLWQCSVPRMLVAEHSYSVHSHYNKYYRLDHTKKENITQKSRASTHLSIQSWSVLNNVVPPFCLSNDGRKSYLKAKTTCHLQLQLSSRRP